MSVKPISDENYVEMLTVNDEGRAIPGTMYPRDLGVVVFHDEDDDLCNQLLAYPHKFFKRDEHGQPVPGTLVRFLVPDYWCDGPHRPSLRALELVAERMGWNEPDESSVTQT